MVWSATTFWYSISLAKLITVCQLSLLLGKRSIVCDCSLLFAQRLIACVCSLLFAQRLIACVYCLPNAWLRVLANTKQFRNYFNISLFKYVLFCILFFSFRNEISGYCLSTSITLQQTVYCNTSQITGFYLSTAVTLQQTVYFNTGQITGCSVL